MSETVKAWIGVTVVCIFIGLFVLVGYQASQKEPGLVCISQTESRAGGQCDDWDIITK